MLIYRPSLGACRRALSKVSRGIGGLWLLLGAAFAMAHGLDVIAQQTADGVTGRARYSDQSPAANVSVEVFASGGGAALADGVTDDEGRFRLRVPAGTGPLKVVVEGEEGHRAEALVASLVASGPVAPTAVGTSAAAGGLSNASGAASATAVGGGPDADEARRMLSLVREDIARLDRQMRLRDVIGGIGYLVGIAGAAAWWMSRRRRS